ncbi:hypothetical protein [Clostridium grantii]|nr:hypothetical protein [Clostridium grantii]
MQTIFNQKIGKYICSFLLVLSPVIAISQQSTFLWGETEIPESLKN